MLRFWSGLQSTAIPGNKLEKRLLRDSGMVGCTPDSDDILPRKSDHAQRLVSPTIVKDDVGRASITEHLDDPVVPTIGKDSQRHSDGGSYDASGVPPQRCAVPEDHSTQSGTPNGS